jgi:hypothetical protein
MIVKIVQTNCRVQDSPIVSGLEALSLLQSLILRFPPGKLEHKDSP